MAVSELSMKAESTEFVNRVNVRSEREDQGQL